MRVAAVLVVPGKPVPWAPKQTNRKTGSRFEPGRQAEQKGKIMDAWERGGHSAFLEKGHPVRIGCTFFIPRPKSHYRSGRYDRELRPESPVRPASKPDLSNLVKLVEDALTGVLWADDDQVVQVTASKEYVDWWEQPRSVVGIEA